MIRVGSDPEFFIQKGRHFLSAHELPFGTKHQPMQVQHGHVQIDGLAVECNVRPAQTREEFIQNVGNIVLETSRLVNAYLPGAKVVARPSVFFGQKKLQKLPGWALALGCDSDYDAYTGKPNPRPNPNAPFRTGSGHVHVSWTKDASLTSKSFQALGCAVTKELDYYLGLPSLLFDNDSRRRSLYGKAGAFRPKTYGVEYRVLSNRWLSSPDLVGWVFDQTVRAVNRVLDPTATRLSDQYGLVAQTYINRNDSGWVGKYPDLAKELGR